MSLGGSGAGGEKEILDYKNLIEEYDYNMMFTPTSPRVISEQVVDENNIEELYDSILGYGYAKQKVHPDVMRKMDFPKEMDVEDKRKELQDLKENLLYKTPKPPDPNEQLRRAEDFIEQQGITIKNYYDQVNLLMLENEDLQENRGKSSELEIIRDIGTILDFFENSVKYEDEIPSPSIMSKLFRKFNFEVEPTLLKKLSNDAYEKIMDSTFKLERQINRCFDNDLRDFYLDDNKADYQECYNFYQESLKSFKKLLAQTKNILAQNL